MFHSKGDSIIILLAYMNIWNSGDEFISVLNETMPATVEEYSLQRMDVKYVISGILYELCCFLL